MGRPTRSSRRPRLGGFFQRPLAKIFRCDDRSTTASTLVTPDNGEALYSNNAPSTFTIASDQSIKGISSEEKQMIFHKSLKQMARRYLNEADERHNRERLSYARQTLNCSYDTTNRTDSSTEAEEDSVMNSFVEEKGEIVANQEEANLQPNFWVRALSSVSVCTMPELCSGENEFTECGQREVTRRGSVSSVPMNDLTPRARHNSILMDEMFCVAADEEPDYDDVLEDAIEPKAPTIPIVVSRQTSSLPDKTPHEMCIRDDDSTISTRLTFYLNGDFQASGTAAACN